MGGVGGGDTGAPGREGPAGQTQGRKGFRQEKTVTFAFSENEMGMESGVGGVVRLGRGKPGMQRPGPKSFAAVQGRKHEGLEEEV